MSEAATLEQAQVAASNGSLHVGTPCIPISRIRENPVALRTVNRTNESYKEFVDSIRRDGILNPIVVREIRDEKTGEMVYGLIDGLHRFSGAQDAGLTEIPAHVRNMENAAVLEAQIIANIHKHDTRPVEYSRQLMRILAQNPMLTVAELATRIAKSPTWLGERLGLVKLPEDVGKLVDDGQIKLANAYTLAKLAAMAPNEVANYIDRAITMQPAEFVPIVTGRIKEIRDARRKGTDAVETAFEPHPVLRKLAELKDEMTNPSIGPVLVKEFKVKDPTDAFNLGVKWALQMDPATVQLRKDREAEREKALKDEQEKRKRERETEKERKAQEVAAELKLPK